jgi:hypothetical protein
MGIRSLAAGAAGSASITPTDPGLSAAERERLTPQCAAVLGVLRRGPAWNYELASIGLSYTRRLSDLRAHGYQVDIVATGEHGVHLYGLIVSCRRCAPYGLPLITATEPTCPMCAGHHRLVVSRLAVPGCELRHLDLETYRDAIAAPQGVA